MRLHIVDPNQAKQTRRRRGDVGLCVLAWLGCGWPERTENRERCADAATRRVDGHVGRSLQPGDPCAVLTPFGKTGSPSLRCLGGIGIDRRVAPLLDALLTDPAVASACEKYAALLKNDAALTRTCELLEAVADA